MHTKHLESKSQETYTRKMEIVCYTTENEWERERERKSVCLRPKAYYISCLIIVTLQSEICLKQIKLIIWHSLSLSLLVLIEDFQCCFEIEKDATCHSSCTIQYPACYRYLVIKFVKQKNRTVQQWLNT